MSLSKKKFPLYFSKLALVILLVASARSFAAPNPFVRVGDVIYDTNLNAYKVIEKPSDNLAKVIYWTGHQWDESKIFDFNLENAASTRMPSIYGISTGDIVFDPDGTQNKVIAITHKDELVVAPWNGTAWFGARKKIPAWGAPTQEFKTYKDTSIGDFFYDKNKVAQKIFGLSSAGRAFVRAWNGKDWTGPSTYINITPEVARSKAPSLNGIAIDDIVFNAQNIECRVLAIAPNGDFVARAKRPNDWLGEYQTLNVFTLKGRPKNKPQLPADPDKRFDEMAEAKGVLAKVYARIKPILSGLDSEKRNQINETTRTAFQGDNPLSPAPRFLTEDEYENVLRPGILQRGTALLRFLEDHYSGEKRYAKDGIIPAQVVEAIIARHGESHIQLNPKAITFPYGPDLARDQNGNWRVEEDSIGMLGGTADLIASQEILFQAIPDYKKHITNSDEPLDFYRETVARMKAAAVPASGRVVAYLTSTSGDHEKERLQKIFEYLGVTVLDKESKSRLRFAGGKAFIKVVGPSGVEIEDPVGFIYLNMEHEHLDPAHQAYFKKALLERVEKFATEDRSENLRQLREQAAKFLANRSAAAGYPKDAVAFEKWTKDTGFYQDILVDVESAELPGLVEGLEKGTVPSNYSPGVDFLNDKELYSYVEKFIRFYLGEEPIFQNIQTLSFAKETGSNSLDEKLFEKVKGAQNDWVIKHVDERGGKGVVVGPRVSTEEYQGVLEAVRKNPKNYIVQEYISLSMLDEHIVDMRIHASISNRMLNFVSRFPWGRTISRYLDGKVNLSGSGKQQSVFVLKTMRCEDLF